MHSTKKLQAESTKRRTISIAYCIVPKSRLEGTYTDGSA